MQLVRYVEPLTCVHLSAYLDTDERSSVQKTLDPDHKCICLQVVFSIGQQRSQPTAF